MTNINASPIFNDFVAQIAADVQQQKTAQQEAKPEEKKKSTKF